MKQLFILFLPCLLFIHTSQTVHADDYSWRGYGSFEFANPPGSLAETVLELPVGYEFDEESNMGWNDSFTNMLLPRLRQTEDTDEIWMIPQGLNATRGEFFDHLTGTNDFSIHTKLFKTTEKVDGLSLVWTVKGKHHSISNMPGAISIDLFLGNHDDPFGLFQLSDNSTRDHVRFTFTNKLNFSKQTILKLPVYYSYDYENSVGWDEDEVTFEFMLPLRHIDGLQPATTFIPIKLENVPWQSTGGSGNQKIHSNGYVFETTVTSRETDEPITVKGKSHFTALFPVASWETVTLEIFFGETFYGTLTCRIEAVDQ